MFKKILFLIVVAFTVGSTTQIQAQSVNVSIGGSTTGAALGATAATPVAPLCFGGTSSVTVTPTGGSGTYSYTVDGGTAVTGITAAFAVSLTSGAHSVVVSSGSGCTPATVSITVPAAPAQLTASFASSTVQIACGATTASSGTVTVVGGTSPYSYAWTGGASAPTGTTATSAPTLAAGSYNVAVTDANGCATSPALTPITITAPNTTLSATVTPTQIVCNTASPGAAGSTTGSIAVTAVLPAPASPTYAWSNSLPATATVNTLAAGDYTVTISATGYCPVNHTRTISPAPAAVTGSSSSTTADGCQVSAGSVIITGSGGASGATYEVKWISATLTPPGTPARPAATGSPAINTFTASPATFTSLTGGYDYRFVIKDNAGCTTPN